MAEHVRAMEPVVARKMWRTLEPFHGFIYFSEDAVAEYAALGIEGRSGYFGSRSAPMGAVAAPVVTATFFNFSPGLVEHAMQGVWVTTSPEALHAARVRAVDGGLRRALGEGWTGSDEVREALALASVAASACTAEGRPLFAGHASLPWPEEPHLRLWLAITLVREFRGDGHIAALVADGVSPLDALHLHEASGEVPAGALQSTRGWSDGEWAESLAAMVERGLLHDDGSLAPDGIALRQRVEDATDRLAMAPWRELGQDGCDRLRELVRPWSKAIVGGGAFGL